MVRSTSKAAYSHLVSNGALGGAQATVYEAVYKYGPVTAREAREKMQDVSVSTWKRFSELRDMGLLVELGTVTCPVTSRRVIQWDVTDRVTPLEVRKEGKKLSYKNLEALNAELAEQIQDYESFLSTLNKPVATTSYIKH